MLSEVIVVSSKVFCSNSHQHVHINWSNRLHLSLNSRIHASVDGSDFRIHEKRLFGLKWFSHKFKGPGLNYEVGICYSRG